jgi:hypothetical protein
MARPGTARTCLLAHSAALFSLRLGLGLAYRSKRGRRKQVLYAGMSFVIPLNATTSTACACARVFSFRPSAAAVRGPQAGTGGVLIAFMPVAASVPAGGSRSDATGSASPRSVGVVRCGAVRIRGPGPGQGERRAGQRRHGSTSEVRGGSVGAWVGMAAWAAVGDGSLPHSPAGVLRAPVRGRGQGFGGPVPLCTPTPCPVA